MHDNDLNEGAVTIDNAPLNGFHRKLILGTLFGYAGTGYILGIIQFAMVSLVPYMGIGPTWQGLIGATPLIGIFFGSIVFGRLSDRVGRKAILMWSAVLITVFSALQFFVESVGALFALRLLLGFLIGAEYTITPAMATEILPSRVRGRVLTMLNVVWTAGYVLATFVGFALVSADQGWRFMLASSAVFGLVMIASRVRMIESPRWLAMNGRLDEATDLVHRYIGENVSVDNLVQRSEEKVNRSYRALFENGMWKKTTFICVAFVAGVLPLYGIMTFLPTIMDTLGIQNESVASLGVNLCLLLGAIVTVFVLRLSSRKKLTVAALVISGIPLVILGLFADLPGGWIVALFGAQIFFACISGGIVAFVFPSETFPTEIRTTGNGFCTAVSRIGAAIGTFVVPTLIASVGVGPVVLVIGIIQFVAAAFTVAWAPETTDADNVY